MSEIELQKQIDAMRIRLESLERIEYPPIACRVYNDAAFTHNSTGNWVAITMNSERSDPTGMHSTTSNTSRITFALGGWYLVGGHILFDANATGVRGLSVRLGGSTYIGVQYEDNLGASIAVDLSLTTLYYFAATNYVELMGWQNSGGNLDISAASAYSPEFWAIRLP